MAFFATIDRLDQIGLGWLLLLNGVLAAFAALANLGWLLVATSGTVAPEEVAAAGSAPYWLAFVASLVLASSLLAWSWPAARATLLKAQTLGIGFLAAYLVLLAFEVLAVGRPRDSNFVWNPVLFSLLVAYTVYLARRILIPAAALHQSVFRYAHVYAGLLALVAGLLVLWRINAP